MSVLALKKRCDVNDVQNYRGELKLSEPMSKHTSWRVGGPADRYFRPADMDDLCAFMRSLADDEPVTWVGLGRERW